jgi:hypothetical protein
MGIIGETAGQYEPIRVMEVQAGLNQLQAVIETHHKELIRLGERLLPIITLRVENAKNCGEPPEPKRCDIAKIIYEDVNKIRILTASVRDLIKGLEI